MDYFEPFYTNVSKNVVVFDDEETADLHLDGSLLLLLEDEPSLILEHHSDMSQDSAGLTAGPKLSNNMFHQRRLRHEELHFFVTH